MVEEMMAVYGEPADDNRYTKDLEEMLKRIVEEYGSLDHCRFSLTDLVREGHKDGCVIGEAKALLESPSPVAEFLASKGESWDQIEREVEAERRKEL